MLSLKIARKCICALEISHFNVWKPTKCFTTTSFCSSKRDLPFPNKANFDEKTAKKFAQTLSTKERIVLLNVLHQLGPDPPPPLELVDESAPPPSPPTSALYQLAFQQSLPFIGFGFLDNLIMILAGEYIDHTIGVTLSISTMAAAALGNTISDVFGIASAWYVEYWATKFGVSAPALTLEQLQLPSCRIMANLGRALGVAIGCILGMAPLMFQ